MSTKSANVKGNVNPLAKKSELLVTPEKKVIATPLGTSDPSLVLDRPAVNSVKTLVENGKDEGTGGGNADAAVSVLPSSKTLMENGKDEGTSGDCHTSVNLYPVKSDPGNSNTSTDTSAPPSKTPVENVKDEATGVGSSNAAKPESSAATSPPPPAPYRETILLKDLGDTNAPGNACSLCIVVSKNIPPAAALEKHAPVSLHLADPSGAVRVVIYSPPATVLKMVQGIEIGRPLLVTGLIKRMVKRNTNYQKKAGAIYYDDTLNYYYDGVGMIVEHATDFEMQYQSEFKDFLFMRSYEKPPYILLPLAAIWCMPNGARYYGLCIVDRWDPARTAKNGESYVKFIIRDSKDTCAELYVWGGFVDKCVDREVFYKRQKPTFVLIQGASVSFIKDKYNNWVFQKDGELRVKMAALVDGAEQEYLNPEFAIYHKATGIQQKTLQKVFKYTAGFPKPKCPILPIEAPEVIDLVKEETNEPPASTPIRTSSATCEHPAKEAAPAPRKPRYFAPISSEDVAEEAAPPLQKSPYFANYMKEKKAAKTRCPAEN